VKQLIMLADHHHHQASNQRTTRIARLPPHRGSPKNETQFFGEITTSQYAQRLKVWLRSIGHKTTTLAADGRILSTVPGWMLLKP